jgi:membrane protease YdiL (CAAX protease family)
MVPPPPSAGIPHRNSAAISGAEFLLGAAIVVGHNVFQVVPNEVPILFVLGIVSLRVRSGGWAALGFKRPESWRTLMLIALLAAVVRIALGDFLIEPLGTRIWPPIQAPEDLTDITGNLRMAGLYLLIVWTFAAFGEEIVYRSYLLTRAAELCGGSQAAYWIAMVLVSVLFGIGHFYKGPVGIIDSGVAGLILGSAYLLCGRNLWVAVLGHGFIDTIGIGFLFLGWAD